MTAAATRHVMVRCRKLVEEEIAMMLESHCVLDRRTHRPIRATLEEGSAKRHVARLERLKANIDAAIGRKR